MSNISQLNQNNLSTPPIEKKSLTACFLSYQPFTAIVGAIYIEPMNSSYFPKNNGSMLWTNSMSLCLVRPLMFADNIINLPPTSPSLLIVVVNSRKKTIFLEPHKNQKKPVQRLQQCT